MVPEIELCEGGPRCSRIAQGFWRLARWNKDKQATCELIASCLENGITTFDHADIYGDYTCEQRFGEALADLGIDRTTIQLVTKCGIKPVSKRRPERRVETYDTSREHIVASVERSLESLGTDYIDLLLIHRPDPLMDPEAVNAAFTALKSEGKVRYFGVSNFTPAQFTMLAARVEVPLVTNQIEYSVMHLDALSDGTFDLCQELRLRPMAWSPLGGGRLFHEDSAQAKRLRETLHSVGHDLGGATVDQVALAWLLMHPVQLVPVLGTGDTTRIAKAVEVLGLAMSREQWFTIWTASMGHRIP